MPSAAYGTRVLRAGRGGWLFIAFVSLALAGVGLYLVGQGERRGLAVAGFFGLMGLLAGAVLVCGHANLRLADDGFVVGRVWREAAYHWADVSPFRVVAIRGSRRVAFDAAGDRGFLASLARKQFGASTILPESYGMKAEELAVLLNRWRTEALERADRSDDGQPIGRAPGVTSPPAGRERL